MRVSVELITKNITGFEKNFIRLQRFRKKASAGCSAVGSALRSGRRGRAFESPHPDKIGTTKIKRLYQ